MSDATRPRMRVGTRASLLARTQTATVCEALRRAVPGLDAVVTVLETAGDRDGTTPLPEIGGKGLFTDALEAALREGRIDLAVHSLKDLPVEPSEGLVVAAVSAREDPRDVVVSAERFTLETLPHGARLGTCSVRRSAQILALRPDLTILPLRGNVDSRVRKAQEREYDAIVIAAAGVRRLGLDAAISEYLALDHVLPAPGQGALALQCRADDHVTRARLAALDDAGVHAATVAERAFLEGLGGGCAAPIAAFGTIESGELRLIGLVASADGSRIVRVQGTAPASDAARIGRSLADESVRRGAALLL